MLFLLLEWVEPLRNGGRKSSLKYLWPSFMCGQKPQASWWAELFWYVFKLERWFCPFGKEGACLADHFSSLAHLTLSPHPHQSIATPSSHSLGGRGQWDHPLSGEGSCSLNLGPFPKACTSNGSGWHVPRKVQFSRLSSPTDFGWDVKREMGQEAVKKGGKQQPRTQLWALGVC